LPVRSIGDNQPSGPFGHLRRHPQLFGLPRRDGPPFSGRPGDPSESPGSSCPGPGSPSGVAVGEVL